MEGKGRFTSRMVWIISGLLLIGACATPPKQDLPGQDFPRQDLPSPTEGVITTLPSDTALFQEGCILLGTSDKPADYDKARAAFENLLRAYPKSKWRPCAETYRKFLDELNAASIHARAHDLEVRKAQAETDDLKVSLEQARKANRLLQEKLQTETGRLQQENEQLKNDIQRLKQLEIELQRRERSLR